MLKSRAMNTVSKEIIWRGVMPAATTQLKADQSLDLDATGRHLEALIESGVTGLVMCGSLGENQVLSPAEKRTVMQHAISVANGRVPVLSGVAENSTAGVGSLFRSLSAAAVKLLRRFRCESRAAETAEIPFPLKPGPCRWRGERVKTSKRD